MSMALTTQLPPGRQESEMPYPWVSTLALGALAADDATRYGSPGPAPMPTASVPSWTNICRKHAFGAVGTACAPAMFAGHWNCQPPVVSWQIRNVSIWPVTTPVRVAPGTWPRRVSFWMLPREASKTGVAEKGTVTSPPLDVPVPCVCVQALGAVQPYNPAAPSVRRYASPITQVCGSPTPVRKGFVL